MVKIALTIGKEEKKPAISPQWHAVPDPMARSFLKILMRRPSHPANGPVTNRSSAQWAAAWRGGGAPVRSRPTPAGEGGVFREPQLELASLPQETASPRGGKEALQSTPAPQQPERLPSGWGARPGRHRPLCCAPGWARQCSPPSPLPYREPLTMGKPRPLLGVSPTQGEETRPPSALPCPPGSWPLPRSPMSCPPGFSEPLARPSPADRALYHQASSQLPSWPLWDRIPRSPLCTPPPAAHRQPSGPRRRQSTQGSVCFAVGTWALVLKSTPYPSPPSESVPTGQALNQGLLQEGRAAGIPRPSPPRISVLDP